MTKYFFYILCVVLIYGCKNDPKSNVDENKNHTVVEEVKPQQESTPEENKNQGEVDITIVSEELIDRPGRAPHPELPWHVNASIYEVNTRQFSKEGTFALVTPQLARLASIGIEIIWMMPIHPIGKKNRKGSLGSPYSVADFKAVNPAFGSIDDFKTLVNQAHQFNMKVIIDWTANHTAFDHVWTNDHKDYYALKNGQLMAATGEDGKPMTDVAQLNFENKAMRQAMIDAMRYWISECNIDGFRCANTAMVPMDFWEEATSALKKIKPDLFFLADADGPEYHDVFQMTTAKAAYSLFNEIAQGKKPASALKKYLEQDKKAYDDNDYRMYYITNHEENAFNGSVKERMGKNEDAVTKLAFAMSGMPLLYNGQEAALNQRISMYEKNEIPWRNKKRIRLFQKLMIIKQTNKAMWNGGFGGHPEIIVANKKQLGFVRKKGPDAILVISNFDDKPFTVDVDISTQLMTDIFIRKGYDFSKPQKVTVAPNSTMLLQ